MLKRLFIAFNFYIFVWVGSFCCRQNGALFIKWISENVIQTVRDGSKEAFSALFDRYFTRLTAFARTITRSDALAEEAVLDVFLKLWQRGGELRSIDRPDTYLFVAVRNAAVNKLRDAKRFRFEMLDGADVPLARYDSSRVDDSLIEADMMEALERAVEKLPARCKIIFRLMREDGLGRAETARVLDISVKTVDNQLAIAVRKIAEELGIDLSEPGKSKVLFGFLLTL